MEANSDLLKLIGSDTTLRRVAGTHGGEYAGPCPFCGGDDRFRAWPDHPAGTGRWWCRRCARGGDAIAYLVERGALTPAEAGRMRHAAGTAPRSAVSSPAAPPPACPAPARDPPPPLTPPPLAWQAAAGAFAATCAGTLWTPAGARARAWLATRGLSGDTVRAAGLGYNPAPLDPAVAAWATWGDRRVKLYRGIVIPWRARGALWRINIRRLAGSPKYYAPAGCANGLYHAGALAGDRPALIVEGELDALLLAQEAGDLVAPVALGSTSGARRQRWVALLAACPAVLVALDNDRDPAKGERAAGWWLRALPRATRLRPWRGDPGEMAQAGTDLRAWVRIGLAAIGGAAAQPGPLDEARAFAARLHALGIPCDGYDNWAAWLAGVEADRNAGKLDLWEQHLTR